MGHVSFPSQSRNFSMNSIFGPQKNTPPNDISKLDATVEAQSKIYTPAHHASYSKAASNQSAHDSNPQPWSFFSESTLCKTPHYSGLTPINSPHYEADQSDRISHEFKPPAEEHDTCTADRLHRTGSTISLGSDDNDALWRTDEEDEDRGFCFICCSDDD
jgi:hypothetical protein